MSPIANKQLNLNIILPVYVFFSEFVLFWRCAHVLLVDIKQQMHND